MVLRMPHPLASFLKAVPDLEVVAGPRAAGPASLHRSRCPHELALPVFWNTSPAAIQPIDTIP